MSSLVYFLVWSPPPYIPYISSPNQCLVFAAHAHAIATCFAVVSILYHLFLFLVFLSTPYLELYLLPYHYTSIWPFSSLLAEVPPYFLSWQARSHFCVAYYFAHNCYTASLSVHKKLCKSLKLQLSVLHVGGSTVIAIVETAPPQNACAAHWPQAEF